MLEVVKKGTKSCDVVLTTVQVLLSPLRCKAANVRLHGWSFDLTQHAHEAPTIVLLKLTGVVEGIFDSRCIVEYIRK